jgi:hypothetical protein
MSWQKPVCGWEIYLIPANIVIQMDVIAPGASSSTGFIVMLTKREHQDRGDTK